MDHFFATKFCPHFSENPPNVPTNAIFPEQKTLQKVMKITHFDVLGEPFVDRDQASKREPKILQNCVKMHLKSSQNDRGKKLIPVSQWSKMHAVAWFAKVHQNAFIFVVPGVALLTSWMKKISKLSKIDHKMTTKNKNPGMRMIKNARRRPTCKKA